MKEHFKHKVLGQIFTEKPEIELMTSLITNKNLNCSALEPSAGNGKIYDYLKHIIC
jgi:adenine-specific DNA methylase